MSWFSKKPSEAKIVGAEALAGAVKRKRPVCPA